MHKFRSWFSSLKPPQKVAVVVFAVVFGFILSGVIFNGRSSDKKLIVGSAPIIPSVRVISSNSEEKVHEILLYGTTESIRQVVLTAETTGQVKSVDAKEGSVVYKGQPVITLDLKDRNAQLRRANALVEQRELEYKVTKSLTKSGYQAKTKLAEAFALLKSAEAEREDIETDIDNTVIRAPFSGVLEELEVEVGDVIKSLDDSIARIVDYHPYLVVGYVPERYVRSITLGSSASARLVNNFEVHGIIRYVSSLADPDTRTFKVEVEVPNGDGAIVHGMSAEIIIPIGKTLAHLVSSSVFSLNEAGDIGVKTLDDSSIVHFHPIEIIDEDEHGIWVTGLPDQVDIITVGQAFLRDGDKAKRQAEN